MKEVLKIFLITIVAVFITLLLGYCFLNLLWEKDFNKFNYNSAKKETTQYLKENRKELESIASDLYKSKSSKKRPCKYISYSSYKNRAEFSFLKKSEYIQFDMDAQGFLGGQYYGLIYSQDKNIYDGKDLFIYDENKETDDGNNIFIREKISDNWFYYYNDFDGKVDTNKIK